MKRVYAYPVLLAFFCSAALSSCSGGGNPGEVEPAKETVSSIKEHAKELNTQQSAIKDDVQRLQKSLADLEAAISGASAEQKAFFDANFAGLSQKLNTLESYVANLEREQQEIIEKIRTGELTEELGKATSTAKLSDIEGIRQSIKDRTVQVDSLLKAIR